MIDINQYLEETNTVLLTKQAFENLLKETTSVVEELEKIKTEIEEMRSKQNCSCSDCLDILNNHISGLKGDNNNAES